MKYVLIALCGLAVLSGCKRPEVAPVVSPVPNVATTSTVVFTSGQDEVELPPEEKVELAWIDMIGDGVGGGVRATAQLSGDTIVIETGSDMSGVYKVITNTIAIGDLPQDISGAWGAGRIHVKDAKQEAHRDRGAPR